MTRIIGITSGKGGVGKTTTSVNLATVLASLGRSVILVDANLSTPNVGLHLGMPLSKVTLHDVLEGSAFITEAISIHPTTGIRVVPAGLSLENILKTNYAKLEDSIVELLGYSDFIIIDCPAGLESGSRRVIDACDEVLLVTIPELPAVTDALKAKKVAEVSGTHILGTIVNRINGLNSELSTHEIEQMIETPVVVKIPEDMNVHKAIASKYPAVMYAPLSKASREWKRLGHLITGIEYIEELPEKRSALKRIIHRLLNKKQDD